MKLIGYGFLGNFFSTKKELEEKIKKYIKTEIIYEEIYLNKNIGMEKELLLEIYDYNEKDFLKYSDKEKFIVVTKKRKVDLKE